MNSGTLDDLKAAIFFFSYPLQFQLTLTVFDIASMTLNHTVAQWQAAPAKLLLYDIHISVPKAEQEKTTKALFLKNVGSCPPSWTSNNGQKLLWTWTHYNDTFIHR